MVIPISGMTGERLVRCGQPVINVQKVARSGKKPEEKMFETTTSNIQTNQKVRGALIQNAFTMEKTGLPGKVTREMPVRIEVTKVGNVQSSSIVTERRSEMTAEHPFYNNQTGYCRTTYAPQSSLCNIIGRVTDLMVQQSEGLRNKDRASVYAGQRATQPATFFGLEQYSGLPHSPSDQDAMLSLLGQHNALYYKVL